MLVLMKARKKKDYQRESTTVGQKLTIQKHLSSRCNFVNKALSNYHIINWVKCTGIKQFMGVFSRDKISDKHKTGSYVIYFDDSVGSGTHLVVMNIRKDIIECFDSFGLNCPEQVINVSNRLNVNYVYNSTQYQDLLSVLCGYICLYYMD